MLDVWDMHDGESILVEVDILGNHMGWEGKTLLNAICLFSIYRFNCPNSWFVANMWALFVVLPPFLCTAYF